MLALASVGLYLLNRDDPRYQDLPDWDRDANWHFFVGDQHFRYPKIWGNRRRGQRGRTHH